MFKQVFVLYLLIPNVFPDCQCGLRTRLGRILGGKMAKPGQYPWQVFIIKFMGGDIYVCGGSIINTEWILTAAHCLPNASSSNNQEVQRDILVRVGRVSNADLMRVLLPWRYYRLNIGPRPNISTLKEDGIFLVDRWVSHNDIKNKDSSDIGLLHVYTPFKYSAHTRPVCLELPSMAQTFYPTVELSGFGDTSNETVGFPDLKWATVSEVKFEDCSRHFNIDPSKQICFNRGSPGACPGDSGSPYVVEKNGQFYQMAVMSFGPDENKCTEKSVERVGVRVAYFNDWIKKMVNTGTWCSS